MAARKMCIPYLRKTGEYTFSTFFVGHNVDVNIRSRSSLYLALL